MNLVKINREIKVNQKINNTDRKIMVTMYALFAVVTSIFGFKLCMPPVLDEVGTLANTAFLAGDDWSLCVQSMGGFYYKYGVSVLYLPIYIMFKSNPFMMYRMIMVLHMLIMSFIPVIAYYILRKYLNVDTGKKAVLIAIATGGISSTWLYGMYARADVMMMFLPWVLLLILLELLQIKDNKKKKYIFSALLAVVAVYAYMSHSRGIVFVIATFMTVIIFTIIFKKNIVSYIVYVPVTGVMLVIDKIISAYIKNGVYGQYGTQHASMESINFADFAKMFTKRGIIVETKLVIGWLYNLFASTAGMVLIGVFVCVFVIIFAIRKKNVSDQENVFAIFALLGLLGTFTLGALFFFPHVYDTMTGVNPTRGDRMLYGRYTVAAVGPVCFLGLYALTYRKNEIIKLKTKIVSVLMYIAVLYLCVEKVCPQITKMKATNSRYFISLTAFIKFKNGVTNSRFKHLDDAFLKIGLLSLVLMLIILILTEVKNASAAYVACAIMFIAMSVNFSYVFVNMRLERNNTLEERMTDFTDYFNDIYRVDKIANEYPVVYRHSSATLVKFCQFAMPQFNVGNAKYVTDTDQEEFIVIAKKNAVEEAMAECEKQYGKDNYYYFEGYDYENTARDVFFVKGDNLAKLLGKYGNKMIKIEK